MIFADGIYVVKTVSRLKELGGGSSLLEIEFENREGSAVMFGIYSDVLTFLNQEVTVSFRQELVDGEIRPCVNTMTVITKVTALDREEDIKLYINDLPDTGSTVDFTDFELNQVHMNAIVYCSHQVFDSSAKATWVELTIQDKRRNSAKLRLFDPERKNVNVVGKYIKADLKLTKYGYQTQDIEPVEGIHISPNPELELAKQFIIQATKNDKAIVDYMEMSKMMNALTTYIDEDEPEVGYITVRLAMEIAAAREYANMSPIVDVPFLIRAMVFNRGYVISNTDRQLLSLRMQNIMNLSVYGPKAMTKKMLNMLEDKPRIELLEWVLYQQTRANVDTLIKARKFRTHVLSSDKRWS